MKNPQRSQRFGKNNPQVVALVAAIRSLERAVRARHPKAVAATVIIDLGPGEEPRALPVFVDGMLGAVLDDQKW